MSNDDELFQLMLGRTTTKAVERILAAGYRKPRMIEEVVFINILPVESVIRTRQGYTMERLSEGWYRAGVIYAYTPNLNWLPATVLYEPIA